jgi:hypothetical protein
MEKVPVYHIVDEEETKPIPSPYQRYLKWKDIERMQGEVSEASIENIQEAMRDALVEHIAWSQGDIGAKGGPAKKPFSPEMAFALTLCFRDMIHGFSHPYTTPIKATKGGSLGWHPDEYQTIVDAVSYLKYAESDESALEDKTPFKTIQKHYGVSRDTVKNWKNDERFYFIRVFKDRDPKTERMEMEFSGNFYKKEFSVSAKREKNKN